MEKSEATVGKFVGRHLSQIKVLTRLLEHELDAAKGSKDINLDRHIIENILDTMEIFCEDCERVGGRGGRERAAEKPAVARLN